MSRPPLRARRATRDEIRQREQEIWDANFQYHNTTVRPETKRKLKTVYRMAGCFSYGFTPLVWDDPGGWMFSRRAECDICGHVVATNQPSWMAKHAHKEHGADRYPPYNIRAFFAREAA